ncbi:MAG: hypothetical protein WD489_11060 [Rhodovibrionaceae bacterium]
MPQRLEEQNRSALTINWKQGLFRFWLISSAIWMIVALVLMMNSAQDTTDFLTQSLCDTSEMAFEEWAACYQQARGPQDGETWFVSLLGSNWWVLPGGAILIALLICIAAGLGRIVVWMIAGFTRDLN